MYLSFQKITDNYFYLQKMSDILVIYVNLELKFFNERISEYKISNILLNAVCIYLGNITFQACIISTV